MTQSPNSPAPSRWTGPFLICLGLLALARLVANALTPLNLGPDEAQYWRWAQSFDWGYYSKPPLTSWLIGISTGIFGDSEWAIRFFAPVLHGLTALFVFLTARELFGSRIGILAGTIWATMLGVWLSSAIMSTDVPLLACWSAALYFLVRTGTRPSWRDPALLGLAIGLGFLAKYAMIYFVIGLGLATLADPATRRAMASLRGLLAAGIALLVVLPHMLWNAANGFKTVSHTADNANWGAQLINPENGFKFFGDQFAVFGPLTFALLLVVFIVPLVQKTGFWKRPDPRFLAMFILPPLIIILVQAFISRAHANWAASAYPAACILLALWAARERRWGVKLLGAAIALNLALGGIMAAVAVSPPVVAESLGAANAFKRLRAWPETVDAVNAAAIRTGADVIIVDEREVWHGLDYYAREDGLVARKYAWRRDIVPKSASEEVAIIMEPGETALIVMRHPGDYPALAADFADISPAGEIELALGGGKVRRLTLYTASGYAPLPRDENWRTRFRK